MSKATSQRRFVSLRLKWALSTAGGTLLISLIVVLALFSFFTQDLWGQERRTVAQSLTIIGQQLSRGQAADLTAQQVAQQLKTPGPAARSTRVAHQLPGLGLAAGHLVVTVANRQGRVIYTTNPQFRPVKRVAAQRIGTVPARDHQHLVGRAPVINPRTHRVRGYLQVEDDLTNYYQRYRRLALVAGLALTLVAILSGLLGYFLSVIYLRPLREIRETVAVLQADPTRRARVPVSPVNDELSELSRMFNRMLDRTQRYIDQQSQFVGDVSHELRTPVAIIQGHLEMLQRWGKDDPKLLAESIQAALSETKRMNALIQEMLDLTRAGQVEVDYRDAHTAVQKVVHQVYDNLRMLHPDFLIQLDDDLKEDVWVPVYRDHLEQILLILCDNAIKYSTTRKEVHLSLSRNLQAVEIGIQDFGQGMAPEELDRIFDRFYRVDKARSRKAGGNGLGLAIAKRLVEGYHGTVTVESQVGSGSLFRITFPIIDAPAG